MDGLLIFIFLTFVCFIEHIHGYAHCWDNVNGGMYYGTIAVTSSGKHCQPWAAQSPHSHAYNDDAKFPFDTGYVLANNYCRDPDFDFVPWCYTMDPSERWETCDIPICINLPCGINILAGASDPTTLTANTDTNTAINYLAAEYQMPCCGTLKKWKVYVRKAGTIKLQIWRYDSATGNYVLTGENAYVFSVGHENSLQERTIPAASRISVKEGDMIGWRADADDIISYDSGGASNNLLLPTAAPTKGQSVNFGPATVHNSRDYAIGVDVDQNFPPYFTNTANTATATDSTTLYPVGTVVFPLTVTDTDPDDVNSLTVTMTTSSTYFELNATTCAENCGFRLQAPMDNESFQDFCSSTEVPTPDNFCPEKNVVKTPIYISSEYVEIQVKSSPLAVGTHVLSFEVKDGCEQTGVFTVTITVTKAPVNINNLPDLGSVNESEIAETLAFTLGFDSAGPHTCTIDSYSPTRPEGNPFLVKLTPSSDVGVYLKANAAVRYSVTDNYVLNLTCGDGSTSDTKVLTVNIGPNSAPIFQSWPGSVTISGPATVNGQVVFNATVYDAEFDPITMAIPTCNPSPCVFSINNARELSANQDLALHEISSYDVYLSAYDGFTTVTSPLLTITITGLNKKSVFTNLGGSKTVSENTNIGDTVFQVSYYDADGDTANFTPTYAPAACSSLFAVGASDGRITTLASLDYETVTVTSCLLTVTANDGKMDSNPDTITLDIMNIDEPPVFSSTGYTISTPEVAGGTVLPNAGIIVTDPEGTAVTLSLTCATDPGYLSIDSGTKLVTMVTAFDLDPSTPSYTINCIITATDATSQTSTVPLAVVVTDENDKTPTFSQGMYTINILNTQGLGVIGSAPATDADSTSPNNHRTYSLSGSTKFIIDANGNIELTGDITGDTGITTYTLTATVTDGGASPLASTAVVQVLVSDAATVTTTTTTTTAGTVVVGSTDSGFFSSALNIIWFTLAIVLGTFVLVVGGYMLYRLCRKPASSEKLGNYSEEQDNLKDNNAKQNNDDTGIRKRSLSDSIGRPVSGDSRMNIDVRTPTPANTRYQPISVQPAGDLFTSDSSAVPPRTNYLTMHDIKEWKLNQGQWRQALQVGRLKY